jgi:hypothetical protein
MRGGTACGSIPILTQRLTRRLTNILIPIPQGLDEGGHGRRTQFHHRCAHRLMRQRPDQHAPSPLRHHLSHRLRQREGSLTHLLQSRLRYPLPGVRPHAQSRHRLPIPYLTQRLTRRSTNIAIPIPQGLDEGGHRLLSPISPNAHTPPHEHRYSHPPRLG